MFKYLLIAGLISSAAVASEIPTSTKRIDPKSVDTTNYHPYLTESLKGCDPKVLTAAKEDIEAQLEKTKFMENILWAGWLWSTVRLPVSEIFQIGIATQPFSTIRSISRMGVALGAALYMENFNNRQQKHLRSFDGALTLQKYSGKMNSLSKKEDY